MPNIKHSIQEYCKKINSRLAFSDVLAVFVVFVGILFLMMYLWLKLTSLTKEIIYKENPKNTRVSYHHTGLPFGSKSGKTYTFSWCQGSSRIKEKNKIFFTGEDEAQASGRTLSKLCQK